MVQEQPMSEADVEAEREQRVLMLERTGYEVDKLGISKGGEQKRGAK